MRVCVFGSFSPLPVALMHLVRTLSVTFIGSGYFFQNIEFKARGGHDDVHVLRKAGLYRARREGKEKDGARGLS